MRFVVLFATLLCCAQKPAAKAAAPSEPLATARVDRRGAAEACLSGAKPEGLALLFRVEVVRGARVVGSVEVPDRDPRPRYATCRPIPLAAPGDVVRVLAVGPRPRSVVLQLHPDGLPD